MSTKHDLQVAREWLHARIDPLVADGPFQDYVVEGVSALTVDIRWIGLAAPTEYAFGGDYDWSDLEFVTLVSAVTEAYTALDALLAAVIDAVQNSRGTVTAGTVYDCTYLRPVQLPEFAPGESIKAVGCHWSVKAKAT
jgi:hypothetical protein